MLVREEGEKNGGTKPWWKWTLRVFLYYYFPSLPTSPLSRHPLTHPVSKLGVSGPDGETWAGVPSHHPTGNCAIFGQLIEGASSPPNLQTPSSSSPDNQTDWCSRRQVAAHAELRCNWGGAARLQHCLAASNNNNNNKDKTDLVAYDLKLGMTQFWFNFERSVFRSATSERNGTKEFRRRIHTRAQACRDVL